MFSKKLVGQNRHGVRLQRSEILPISKDLEHLDMTLETITAAVTMVTHPRVHNGKNSQLLPSAKYGSFPDSHGHRT